MSPGGWNIPGWIAAMQTPLGGGRLRHCEVGECSSGVARPRPIVSAMLAWCQPCERVFPGLVGGRRGHGEPGPGPGRRTGEVPSLPGEDERWALLIAVRDYVEPKSTCG